MDREFGRPAYDATDQGDFEQGLVFVAMSFTGDRSDELFSEIRDVCVSLGLHARRADDLVGSGVVIREIAHLIERAEFIVCDLSTESPNVYYELGYAHGVGNEADDILLIAAKGATLHFDIAPLRVHFYDSLEDLRSVLVRNLKEMIRRTRRG